MTPTWNSADLDSGTTEGLVHETNQDVDGDGTVEPTSYTDSNDIRKGDPATDPLYSDNLVLWLPLQEANGSTAYDFSGGSHDANYQGATPDNGGDVGGAQLRDVRTPYLDGTDDYIEVPQFFSSPPSSYMISGWMFWDRVQSGSRDVFWDFRDNFGSIVRSGPNSDELVAVHFYDGGFERFFLDPLSENKWYHIVAFYDGTDFAVIVDGSEEARTSTQPVSDENDGNRIGEVSSGSGQESEGSPSDVRVIAPCPSNPISAAQDLYDIWANASTHTSVVKTS
jgi:hypothetical protein